MHNQLERYWSLCRSVQCFLFELMCRNSMDIPIDASSTIWMTVYNRIHIRSTPIFPPRKRQTEWYILIPIYHYILPIVRHFPPNPPKFHADEHELCRLINRRIDDVWHLRMVSARDIRTVREDLCASVFPKPMRGNILMSTCPREAHTNGCRKSVDTAQHVFLDVRGMRLQSSANGDQDRQRTVWRRRFDAPHA